jgi:transposase-like protein
LKVRGAVADHRGVDIQAANAYTSAVATGGGATPGDSITELARQHGVSRESLLELVRSRVQQAQQENGGPPLDPDALDQALNPTTGHDEAPEPEPVGPAGYTSTARSVAARPAGMPSISVLA